MQYFLHNLLLVFIFFLLPVLCGGIVRKIRSRAQGRKGPPLLQNFRDIYRAIQKKPIDGIHSDTFSEIAPSFALFSSLIVWSIIVFEYVPFIVIPFFIAMQRVAITGFAMETGTSFGGLGASREILLSISSEPIFILIILVAQSSLKMEFSMVGLALGLLFFGASIVAIMAELARPPFDDPRTHLELTMVHEAMLLEASGRSLGLFELSYQIKIASYFLFINKLAIEHSNFLFDMHLSPYVDHLIAMLGAIFLSVLVGFWESISARRKWNWVPEIMGLTFLFLLILGTLVKLN
ncbi:MAG: NADH-quinone oxidoreductase subunit H [Leptospiraceae bacterium]|nr:NADH-quinone oxidoreductase subunit H [Leptospiraceae bacterium]